MLGRNYEFRELAVPSEGRRITYCEINRRQNRWVTPSGRRLGAQADVFIGLQDHASAIFSLGLPLGDEVASYCKLQACIYTSTILSSSLSSSASGCVAQLPPPPPPNGLGTPLGFVGVILPTILSQQSFNKCNLGFDGLGLRETTSRDKP